MALRMLCIATMQRWGGKCDGRDQEGIPAYYHYHAS